VNTYPSSRKAESMRELLNRLEEHVRGGQDDELSEMVAGLDPDQERLYHDLMMSASNEGDFYKKKDAKGACEAASRDILKIRAANLAHDLKVVKPIVAKNLAKRWSETYR